MNILGVDVLDVATAVAICVFYTDGVKRIVNWVAGKFGAKSGSQASN